MSNELLYVNALIGFCKHSGEWPSPLEPHGYEACGYERELKVLHNGQDRTVTVDLLCASSSVNHAICIEVKSKTIHDAQLARYSAIQPRTLVQMGHLPPDIDPGLLSHDVVYVTDRPNSPSLARQMEELGMQFPIVVGDESEFTLVHGTISKGCVRQVFEEGVVVNSPPEDWPKHYVSFNSRSSDGRLSPHVMGALYHFLLRGTSFSIDELAIRATAHWAICGRTEQREIRKRITQIVARAQREELSGYYRREGKPQAWVTLRGKQTHPSQRQKLFQRGARFVERLQKNIPFGEGQLDLGEEFYELMLDDDEDEDFDSE